MRIQNSYDETKVGKLYLVPTPIGNLEDMTYRAVRILSEVDVILAEDTRRTKKLLNHFAIDNQTISYHEHNHRERSAYVLERLLAGNDIALVSDAGMPAISDPGFALVEELIAKEISVIVLPGANAALTALVGSGLSTEKFLFIGFLPRKSKEQKEVLETLKGQEATMILYEAPHRLIQTLGNLKEYFSQRRIVLARELTKLYEQYLRGTVQELAEWVKEHPVRGECVLILEGRKETEEIEEGNWWETLSIAEHVAYYEEKEGLSHKEAMRKVAQDRHCSRRDIYQALHVKKDR